MNNKTKTAALNNIWSFPINTLLPVLAFTIPFLLSGPQLITGTIVNTLFYITCAQQIKKHSLYLIALLPSLGAVSHGILFGTFTPYLLFFVPSIWLGNMILMLSFSKLKTNFSTPLTIVFSSLFKTAVLYVSALILVGNHVVPTIFLTAMGIVQLFTAISGGIVTYILFAVAHRKL